MTPRTKAPTAMKILSLSLALVQVFDLLLHLATGQVEPLRITANVVILLWLAGLAAGRYRANAWPLAAVAPTAYLGLNLLFLALEGFTNPAQGGAPRTMLFVLVFVTVALSGVLIYGRGKSQST